MAANLLPGMLVNAVPPADSELPQRRRADLFCDEIGCDRERPDRTFAKPLIGDVGNALLPPLSDAAARDVLAAQQDRAGDGGALTGEHFGQVLLPVAIDAGNAEHFSGPEIEADVLQRAFAGLRGRRHAAELEQRRRAPIDAIWIAPRRLALQIKEADTVRPPVFAEHEADNLIGYLLLRHGCKFDLVDAADDADQGAVPRSDRRERTLPAFCG